MNGDLRFNRRYTQRRHRTRIRHPCVKWIRRRPAHWERHHMDPARERLLRGWPQTRDQVRDRLLTALRFGAGNNQRATTDAVPSGQPRGKRATTLPERDDLPVPRRHG